MNRPDLLAALRTHRQLLGEPGSKGNPAGVPQTPPAPLTRELSPDGSECRIVFVAPTTEPLAHVIAREKTLADRAGYRLEWKLYEDDEPADLVDALVAAGFEPDDEEQVLVRALSGLSDEPLPVGATIERVEGEPGLPDLAAIAREVGRRDVDRETKRLAGMLRDAPAAMTIHLLRCEGQAVASGRTHFVAGSGLAELAGGRTKPLYRRRGFFRALVLHRMREAAARGSTHAIVDALPTSEPILRRLGFTRLTATRPYVYEPQSIR